MDPIAVLEAEMVTVRKDAVGDDGLAAAVALSRFLDLEERIVYPMLDRCGPTGSEVMAEGYEQHEDLLDERDRGDRDSFTHILDDHLRHTRTKVLPLIHSCLDPTGLDDLGDALHEAWASREEADQPLHAPLEDDAPTTSR